MKLLLDLYKADKPEKIRLLRGATQNEQRVIVYTLNKNWSYGIFRRVSIRVNSVSGEPTNELFDLLDKLRARKLVGSAARDATIAYRRQYGMLIDLVLSRGLQCRVGIRLIKEALPLLMPIRKRKIR